MKKIYFSHSGATMIELMAALAILSLGITALLQTLGGGIKYAKDTEDNIKAINIAREGIESVINIRDTNWLRFSSDRHNCWFVQDYKTICIGNSSPPVIASGSYTVIGLNGAWYLSGTTSGLDPFTSWSTYRDQYKVGIDSNGFYTQTGISSTPCSSDIQSNCLTIFTREINIVLGSGTVSVQSIARWNLERPRNVTIETTLSNWKSRF